MSPKRPAPTTSEMRAAAMRPDQSSTLSHDSSDPAINPDGWIVRTPDGVVIGIAEGLRNGSSGARYVAVRLDPGGGGVESKTRRVLVPFGFVSLGPAQRHVILYGLTLDVCALLPADTGEPVTAHDEAVILWRCILGTADDIDDEREPDEIIDRDIARRSMSGAPMKEPPAQASQDRRTKAA